jgi:ubiquinone/menaquinone biosynthesis C-methylase UbiE
MFHSIKKWVKQKLPTVGTNHVQARIDWIEKTLSQIPEGKRILDAGAGELQFKIFCSHLDYVSQDFALYDGSGNGSGLQPGKWDTSKIDIISDICSIPEPDSSFDVIMCIEVFEHIPDPVAAIIEFKRLLRKNGLLLITAPFYSLTHLAPYHYCTGFSQYFYKTHLEKLGFNCIETIPNGNYYECLGSELRRIDEVAQKYSGKRLNVFNKFIIMYLLSLLNKLIKTDKGSNELFNVGYHVLARRI